MVFIQQSLPKPPVKHSDVDCLNLNITVPKLASGIGGLSRQKLPVFIWTHGGGFVVGANSWPQYDHAKLVKLAAKNGVPIIGVGINFRLGLSGLLTSEELRQRGYKPNNTLRDQRNAFQWVRQHISGFGGDPDNVTVIGESTGAVSTTLHLYSPEKLFNRAIATGGSFLLVGPFSYETYEGIYQQVLSVLGIDKLEPDERVNQLLSLPLDDVIARLPPSIAFLPAIDGEIVPTRPTYDAVSRQEDQELPGKKWLDGFMIGDSQFDASTLGAIMGHLKTDARKRFTASLKTSLAKNLQAADSVLEAYGFNSPPLASAAEDDEVAFKNYLHFVNDVGYYAATVSFARGWPEHKLLTFAFNEPNPWPGLFTGEATHVLDVVFLFQNYNDKLSPAQKKAAESFGLDFARFIAGQQPWPAYSTAKKNAKVFGPSVQGPEAVAKIISDNESREIGRRTRILEIGKEIGFDALAGAVVRFQIGL
ncbi:uncharacterized protein A1O9_11749 [Exophiala aquamarina CBS 119918]|uniref:Carboxylic ester hydrolase n=1 Tax=Exophiala aquamarina CBS 119918 TaxID=1182545 RepID=A0A072NYM2_9EURO|nr:uncharacterized protein A1O9_11749 [Exophiala aquamarina CBS 119918]KEF52123.1 hypothetical protein A1O9_11749 [Exophiala aquamarina CBS 119918]